MKGTIYCIQAGEEGPIKIGFTTCDPVKRLRQLQTGNPFPLRMIGSFEGDRVCEILFHAAFSEWRMAGEWFRNVPVIHRAFDAVSKWSGGFPTIPPKTIEGRDLLRQNFEVNGVRYRYPDESLHSEIDWDDVGAWVQEMIAELDEFEGAM